MAGVEWVEVNLPWMDDDCDLEESPRDFYHSAMRRPGVQIEVIDPKRPGAGVQRLLIGDVNEETGWCGCCAGVRGPYVVLRYRELVSSDIMME